MYQIRRYQDKSPSGTGSIEHVWAMEYSLCRHRTSNKDYIEFRHGGGCSSIAGRKGGVQSIKLAPRCAQEHTIIHEVYFVIRNWTFESYSISIKQSLQILHALGLLHEHQRHDRDQYIDVNMTAATQYGFFKDFEKASFSRIWNNRN